jgi:hypothetical protein
LTGIAAAIRVIIVTVITALQPVSHDPVTAAGDATKISAQVGFYLIAVITFLHAGHQDAITTAGFQAVRKTTVILHCVPVVTFFVAHFTRCPICSLNPITTARWLALIGTRIGTVQIAIIAALPKGLDPVTTARLSTGVGARIRVQ